MAYSRYAHLGKGLTDRAQRAYNVKRYTSSSSSNMMETIWDIMYTPEGKVRGLYSSDVATTGTHKGKTFAEIARIQPSAVPVLAPAQPRKVGSQFGAHQTGYGQVGRGYPAWVTQMLGKGSSLGKPPGEEGVSGIGKLTGLSIAGYLLFKLLV